MDANRPPTYDKQHYQFYAAVLFVIGMVIIAAATLIYFHGRNTNTAVQMKSGTYHSAGVTNLQPELQKVKLPPTASDISNQLHGTNFTDLGKPGSTLVLDEGSFNIADKKYAVDTFVSSAVRDQWLKLAEPLGVVPTWVSPNAVVYASVS